jgi:hypothetical protein
VLTKERFGQGMTVREYVDQMSMNKERFLGALDSTTVAPGDAQVLKRFEATRKILVITEDWCGAAIASLRVTAEPAPTRAQATTVC